MRPRLFGLGWTVFVLLLAREAVAEPQGTVGLTAGWIGRGEDSWWTESRFHLGSRGDVLFGRKGPWDWGLGPYGELLTAFDDLSLGAGASALVPIHSTLPLVLSGGGYGRWSEAGWQPGLTGQLFWGSRSYNYHGSYIMTAGLIAQGRIGVGSSKERAVVVALQLDGQVLGLPFLLLYEALAR